MIVYSKAKGHQLLAYKHYEKDGLSQENLMPLKKQACEEFLPPPSFFFEPTSHLKVYPTYPTELLLAYADEAI